MKRRHWVQEGGRNVIDTMFTWRGVGAGQGVVGQGRTTGQMIKRNRVSRVSLSGTRRKRCFKIQPTSKMASGKRKRERRGQRRRKTHGQTDRQTDRLAAKQEHFDGEIEERKRREQHVS